MEQDDMEGRLVKLVKLISQHPCLYNHTLPEKVGKENQDAAWSQIAAEMNWTESKCKDKWRTVRNGYVRSLKLATESMGARQRRPYYLADELQFVAPFVKQHTLADQDGDSNDNDNRHFDESSNDDPEYNPEQESAKKEKKKRPATEFISTPNQSKKVKKEKEVIIEVRPDTDENRLEAWLDQRSDPMDPSCSDYRKMFLMSLLSDIHLLSDSNMLVFKIKVLEMIQQLLQCQGMGELGGENMT